MRLRAEMVKQHSPVLMIAMNTESRVLPRIPKQCGEVVRVLSPGSRAAIQASTSGGSPAARARASSAAVMTCTSPLRVLVVPWTCGDLNVELRVPRTTARKAARGHPVRDMPAEDPACGPARSPVSP